MSVYFNVVFYRDVMDVLDAYVSNKTNSESEHCLELKYSAEC